MKSEEWGMDDRAVKPVHNIWDEKQRMDGGRHAWHWLLTVIALAVTTIGVFLVHFLLRDERNLSAVQVGLIFLVPAFAVLFTAFLLEYQTSLMTPRFSRNGQALVALIASVAVFVIGCLGQLSFFSFTYQPDNYIFLVDKSYSMGYTDDATFGSDTENQRKDAFANLLNQLPDGTQVGFVLFNDTILDQYTISALNIETRLQMLSVLDAYDGGGTDFSLALRTALNMLENHPILIKNITHIIFLTDGNSEGNPMAVEEFEADCLRLNAVVSCVQLGTGSIADVLSRIIQTTKGRSVYVTDINNLSLTLSVVSEGGSFDVLHNDSDNANLIAGILFVLTGIILGFSLSLMLSRTKQFRFQLILSPLMGAAAFVFIKYLQVDVETWVWIASAFCLYGIVFMQILYPAKSSTADPNAF